MPDLHQGRTPATTRDGGPGIAPALDGKPFRPYTYKGGETEPAAVTAARERHRAVNAEIERLLREAALRDRDGAQDGTP